MEVVEITAEGLRTDITDWAPVSQIELAAHVVAYPSWLAPCRSFEILID